MAQPKVDEEKKINIDESIDKIVIPIPDKTVIDKLPWKVKELYNYKAKYEINDDGSLTFYPTPSLATSEDSSDPAQSSPSAPLQPPIQESEMTSVPTTLSDTKEAPTAIKSKAPSVNVDSIGYMNEAPKPAPLVGQPPMSAPLPGAPSPMPAPLPGQAPLPEAPKSKLPRAPFPGSDIAFLPGQAPVPPPLPGYIAPMAQPRPITSATFPATFPAMPAPCPLPTVSVPLPGQIAKAPMAAPIPSPLSGDNEAPMAPTLSSTKKVTEQMMSAIRGEGCKEPACCSNSDAEIVDSRSHSSICSFITSSLEAWNKHYPFRFKPEHIWLLILQAVAVHVDKNAEKLRNKYVTHEGKKDLIVEISRDPSYEEWVNTIQTFAAQIDENTVKDTCKILECDFSKSTLTEKIATKITIMDICKNYFMFFAMTCCGFPRITLDGNKQDWIKLKAKAVKLLNEKVTKKFGSEWGEALLPLLDRFIIAFDGNIDCLFWNSMIKRGAEHRSGGKSWYSGWFNILFPFVNKQWSKEWNEFCVPYAMDLDYVSSGDNNDYGKGVIPDNYPTGIASAPVTWIRQDIGKEFKMKFLAGFVGHTQDEESMEICPNVSWCIAYQEHL